MRQNLRSAKVGLILFPANNQKKKSCRRKPALCRRKAIFAVSTILAEST
jgi:hypothetical protein